MMTLRAFIISLVLSCLGLALFLYKVYYLDFPILPKTASQSWHIEAKVEFMPKWNTPVKLTMMLPQNNGNYVLVDENFISQGYGLSTLNDEASKNRMGIWSKRKANGEQVIFYRGVLYKFDSAALNDKSRVVPEKIDRRALLGQAENSADNPYLVALDSIIAELKDHSADETTFISELYKLLNNPNDDRIKIIHDQSGIILTIPQMANLILNESGIPSRIVNGVQLEKERRFATLTKWIEIYKGGQWVALDANTGKLGMEAEFFPWWYGSNDIVTVEGGKPAHIRVSIKQNTEEAIDLALWKGKKASELLFSFSLFSLPIDSQLVFKVLLLVPVGAFVIAFLRQIIGVRTFGTFMPVLVALSFRETQLFWGIGMFTAIIAIGMFIRSQFDHLQLLLVPRLASILTIVVLLMAFLTIITNKLGINAGLSISLFPMVILTMTIERMTIAWEEYGGRYSITTGLSSMAAAIVAFLCMNNTYISHLAFVFPELLLVVLAMSIILGRYHGYKLTEFVRFKALKRLIES